MDLPSQIGVLLPAAGVVRSLGAAAAFAETHSAMMQCSTPFAWPFWSSGRVECGSGCECAT
ncbi:exported hypothetical protein [Thiomonas delicata]|uniref:Uncharacterized protein n=1 Tax=Thiomonas delicata TaxID=364030 RepID=A0A238D3G4_THIDL|nr:exported hypothetical protein [Thiomonas delicata]